MALVGMTMVFTHLVYPWKVTVLVAGVDRLLDMLRTTLNEWACLWARLLLEYHLLYSVKE